jgi:23S rRNA pseudouridine955/2504/2580 synthase
LSLKIITIKENDSGQRLDKFMMKAFKQLPKSKLYSAIRKKDIKLNGKKCIGNEILSVDDSIRVWLPDDILESLKTKTKSSDCKKYQKSDKPLDIVYEDENIILVFKPKGVDVHSGDMGDSVNRSDRNSIKKSDDTMVSRLLGYLEYIPESEQSFVPAFCNRLDRNTEGILIAAKNAKSLREMNECIRKNAVHKKYLAVIKGYIKPKENRIVNYHSLAENNTVSIYDSFRKDSKETITEYKVLKEKNGLSLVEINLITGRKHQIRAVFSHIGHPVLGDNKYGDRKLNNEYKLNSQLLIAYKISFQPENDMSIAYLNGREFELDDKYTKKIKEYFD